MDLATALPLMSVLAAAVGSWIGVKIALSTLQLRVDRIEKLVDMDNATIHRHAEDLLVHDLEIDSALVKLDIPRVRRQRVRDP